MEPKDLSLLSSNGMKIMSIEVEAMDKGRKSVKNLNLNLLKLVNVAVTVPHYQQKFPLFQIIMDNDLSYRTKQEFVNLIYELRGLARIKQRHGLESLIKNISKQINSIDNDDILVIKTIYKEHSVVQVSFSIFTGDDDPNDITDYVGLTPASIVRKGDVIRRTKDPGNVPHKYSFSRWDVHSTLSDQATIEEHLQQLLNICRPYKGKLIRMAKKYGGARVGVGVHLYHWNPQFEFDAAMLKELGEYDTRLWIDMYPERGNQS